MKLMTTIKSNISSGRQLRAARVLAGLTQSQLSIEAGFNPRAAKYWERQRKAPPTTVPSTLQAIEAALRRFGVELFTDPSPGCRLISSK
jgi:transcriptional regulator with XRE-family HTH domain